MVSPASSACANDADPVLCENSAEVSTEAIRGPPLSTSALPAEVGSHGIQGSLVSDPSARTYPKRRGEVFVAPRPPDAILARDTLGVLVVVANLIVRGSWPGSARRRRESRPMSGCCMSGCSIDSLGRHGVGSEPPENVTPGKGAQHENM